MTTDQNNCGLKSLLSMTCRNRAEVFARHLQSRLNSLDSENTNGSDKNENTWIPTKHKPTVTIPQPQLSTDSDIFFDFGLPESPVSPERELGINDVNDLINKRDDLVSNHSEICHCSTSSVKLSPNIRTPSNDSDSSDGPYYDLESDLEQRILANNVNNLVVEDEMFTNKINGAIEGTVERQLNGFSNKELQLLNHEEEQDISSLEYLSENETTSTEIEEKLIIQRSLGLGNQNDTEIYCSTLNVEKDLTVECPNTINGHELSIEPCVDAKTTEKHFAVEDLEIVELTPRVRRCSSLKTGKTPPGTPGRKKIVRFADVLGLDLADVRTFLDEIPKIPNSAYDDLKDVDLIDENNSFCSLAVNDQSVTPAQKILVPLFQQPGGQINFLENVRENYVCLENALVEDPVSFYISGIVRVRNLDFHKSVHIRYTLDSWKNYSDVQGTYVQNSCDGFSDKFKFFLYAHTLAVGQQLEFAVRFSSKGCQYWDNNHGKNYRFECLPVTNHLNYAPIIGGGDHDWGATFYYQEENDLDNEEDVDNNKMIQTVIKEYITTTLENNNCNNYQKNQTSVQKKSDVITLLVILIFSFMFMFIQKAIYFAK